MKAYYLVLTIVLLYCACQPNGNTNYRNNGNTNYNSEASQTSAPELRTYNYPQYGFSISAPCEFEEAPAQTKGKNLVSVGGFVNKGNRQNFTFYQLIVTETHKW